MDVSYEMEPNYLRVHEINYELKIRGVATSTSDIPQKRKFLRRELRKDAARPNVVHELTGFNFETERAEITSSIQSISELVDNFDGTNDEVAKRIQSRLTHIEGRLKRIPDNIADEVSGFRGDNLILTSTLRDDFEEIVDKHKRASQGPCGEPAASTSFTHSYPLHKWTLKFAGMTSELSVNAFLEQVEELSFARNISKEALFRSSVELFTGQALVWYRHARSKVSSWDQLVSLLRKDFLSPRHDKMLKEQIMERKQGKDEPVVIYIAAMENLYSRLIQEVPQEEKLGTIRENLLPEYHMYLALQNITSVEQLGDLCRNLEEASVMKNKGNTKSYGARVAAMEPDLQCQSIQPGTSQQGRTSHGSDDVNKNRVRRLDEVRCFRCNRVGHVKRECRQFKKQLRCFGCGKEGVIRPNCPRCTKNSRPRGTE